MIRSIYINQSGQVLNDLQLEAIPPILKDTAGFLWVDFQGETTQVCEPILHEMFGFHPLAVDDALREAHVPKLDDWQQYLYIVLHAISFTRQGDDLEMLEVDVFLGKNYLVTHHDMPIHALERAWEVIQKDERFHKKGADHVFYRLSDEIINDFMLAVDEIDEEIEWVEDQVFDRPIPSVAQQIFTLKRVTLHLRRSLSPLREVFNKLARDEYYVIDKKDRIYFRDVYDHLVRLYDICESLRDLVGGALDTYLSVINNRMNEVMKTLTIITTIFMPLSFLAGFFGMNYFTPDPSVPLWSWVSTPSFIITLAIFFLTPAFMFWWMRRRGWM